jgi:hypothetical protein
MLEQLVQTSPNVEAVQKLLNASVYVSAANDSSNPYLQKNLRSLADLQGVVQASAVELAEVLRAVGAEDIDGEQ